MGGDIYIKLLPFELLIGIYNLFYYSLFCIHWLSIGFMTCEGVAAILLSPSTKGVLALPNVKSIKLENGSFSGMIGNWPVGGGLNP